jgi:DNA (cytosine-5)-methyltransferase 1
MLIAGTLNANGKAAGSATQQDAESGMLVTHALRADGFDASEDGSGRGTPIIPIDMRQASRGGKFTNNRKEGTSGGAPGTGIGEPGDPSPTVTSSHVPAIAFSSKDHGADAQRDLSPTLRAGNSDQSHPNAGAPPAVSMGGGVRRLTPRECERLQGFPDDYTLIEFRGRPAADGPRYKAIGNSMAVPVMRWILSRIEQIENFMTADIVKKKMAA